MDEIKKVSESAKFSYSFTPYLFSKADRRVGVSGDVPVSTYFTCLRAYVSPTFPRSSERIIESMDGTGQSAVTLNFCTVSQKRNATLASNPASRTTLPSAKNWKRSV